MNPATLELATPLEKAEKGAKLKKHFKLRVFLVLVIEFLLLAGTTATVVVFRDFIWTQAVHFVLAVRFVLLFVVLCMDVDIYKIKGVNKYYRTVTHFSYYKALGLWLLFGFLFLYLVYWWIPIVDIIHFTSRPDRNVQFAIYLILDVLFILEHWVSYLLVYKSGIVNQIRFQFPKKKRDKV